MDPIDSAAAFYRYLEKRAPSLAKRVRAEMRAQYSVENDDGTLSALDFGITGADIASSLSASTGSSSASIFQSATSVLDSLLKTTVALAPQVVKTIGGLQEIKDNAARAKNGQAPVYRTADGSLVTITPGVQGPALISPAQGTPANNWQGAGAPGLGFQLSPTVIMLGIGAVILLLVTSGRK